MGRSRRLAKSIFRQGYTAALKLAKSPCHTHAHTEAMPRIAVLIIVLVIIVGALYFLSTVPKQQPTKTIEVEVAQPGPSAGNAH